jgi:DNA-binding Lrp family transcriptional regulator
LVKNIYKNVNIHFFICIFWRVINLAGKVSSQRGGSKGSIRPTRATYKLLEFLKDRAVGEYVYKVDIRQSELARTLNITRQALSVKLRPLIRGGYIRTGRGFIEITEKGMMLLGYITTPVFILVSIEPKYREEVYNELVKLKLGQINRVSGDVDLIIQVDGSRAAELLNHLSRLPGVKETKTYFTLETLK